MKYQGAEAYLKNITLKGQKITTLEYLPKELPKLKKLIINNTRIKTLKLLPSELNRLEYLELINNKIKTLIQLPRELPSLTTLIIDEPYLKSLQKMPRNMPNLKTLRLPSRQFLDLECVTPYIKDLENLEIGDPHIHISHPLHLESMSQINKFPNLPNLRDFSIKGAKFKNMIGFPKKMPYLIKFGIKYCKFNNLIGFPEILGKKPKISFYRCEIGSFEGFNVDINKNLNITIDGSTIYSFEGLIELDTDSDFLIINSSINSLVGLSQNNLHKILAILYCAVYRDKKNLIKLSSKGMQLLDDCINKEFHESLVPPWCYFIDENLYQDNRKWYELEKEYIPKEIAVENSDSFPSFQDIKDSEKELFIPEKVDLLYEYYKKNKFQLACQYKDDPKSLTDDEMERLLKEGDFEVLKLLQNSVPSNDPVLLKFIEKFAIWTKNGYKIL